MTLVRWEPFRNAATIQDRINRVFDDVFSKAMDGNEEIAQSTWRPSVDIYDTDNAIVLTAELPGVSKEDIQVEVKENVLTLKGERSTQNEVEGRQFFRRERISGTFFRSFTLPMETDLEKITAKFVDGVLTLEIPKPEEKKPKQIAIDVQ